MKKHKVTKEDIAREAVDKFFKENPAFKEEDFDIIFSKKMNVRIVNKSDRNIKFFLILSNKNKQPPSSLKQADFEKPWKLLLSACI